MLCQPLKCRRPITLECRSVHQSESTVAAIAKAGDRVGEAGISEGVVVHWGLLLISAADIERVRLN